MKRWGTCAAAALCAAGAASAADVKWTYEGAIQALYTDNVFFTPDSSGSAQTKSSAGGSLSADVEVRSTSPRNELSAGYRPSYSYYSSESGASNLQHFVDLRWKTFASQNTSFQIDEAASYSPESNNFKGRGVDQAFTIGPRASQLRNTTGLSVSSRLSPRWSFTAGYGYRLLQNGKVDLPEDGSTTIAPVLFDEEGHTGTVGASYQLSPAATFGMKADYTSSRYEEELFGSALQKTSSVGASLSYGWAVAERVSLTFGLGGYRTTDSNLLTASGSSTRRSTDVSADIGLSRTYRRGSLALGLARGLSTFDGLTRRVDLNGDGTIDATPPETASLGSATRTTLHGSYSYDVTSRSRFGFDLNGTLREQSSGGGHITTMGAGVLYGLRFANWGGLQATYTYTRQRGSSELGVLASDLSTSVAQLGLFFRKP